MDFFFVWFGAFFCLIGLLPVCFDFQNKMYVCVCVCVCPLLFGVPVLGKGRDTNTIRLKVVYWEVRRI